MAKKVTRPKALRTLSDLKPAPYNPREIGDEALAGLKASIDELGDLSGIVWNARDGKLVAGHQRMRALTELYGDGLVLDVKARTITTPAGETFGIRVVDWDEPKAKLANVRVGRTFTAVESERLPG